MILVVCICVPVSEYLHLANEQCVYVCAWLTRLSDAKSSNDVEWDEIKHPNRSFMRRKT